MFGANGLVGYTDMPQMNGDAILIIKDGSGVGTISYAQDEFSVIGTLNYLTRKENYDLRYLYFALSVFNFQPYKNRNGDSAYLFQGLWESENLLSIR